MTIKGVIFDLGDTLMYFDGEWEDVHSRAVADLLAFLQTAGLELDTAAFRHTFGANRDQARRTALATRVEYPMQRSLRETLVDLGYPDVGRSLLEKAARTFFRTEEACWTAFPDAVPTLKGLAQAGYRLGLISNASDDSLIQRLTRALALAPLLHPALNSAGVGIRKPDPQIFQLVLEEWDLEPTEVVMVGDTLEADILGAQLTGMRGILALMTREPRLDPPVDKITPDATIGALAELPPLLTSWQGKS